MKNPALTAPTGKLLQAIHSLNGNPDWELVMGWLDESLQSIREENDVEPDTGRFRQNQGKCQVLSSILSVRKQAFEALRNRIETAKPPRSAIF